MITKEFLEEYNHLTFKLDLYNINIIEELKEVTLRGNIDTETFLKMANRIKDLHLEDSSGLRLFDIANMVYEKWEELENTKLTLSQQLIKCNRFKFNI